MASTVWGKNQLGFLVNGETTETTGVGKPVPQGIVNTSTTPNTVYTFGYAEQKEAILNLIGNSGVTADSVVIDNNSQKKLGTVSFIGL
ncbi:hypothetical protein REH81_28195 [Vibrio rotiferianus]